MKMLLVCTEILKCCIHHGVAGENACTWARCVPAREQELPWTHTPHLLPGTGLIEDSLDRELSPFQLCATDNKWLHFKKL